MIRRRMRAVRLAAVFPLLLATACGFENLVMPTKGKIAIDVAWPQKAGYHLATIPASTTHVEVNIVGEGIAADAPIHATITPDGLNNATDYLEVPIGPKVVQVLAFDVQNREVAHGIRAIAVTPNSVAEYVVTLTPDEPGDISVGSPTPIPTDSNGSPLPTPSTTAGPAVPIITTIAGGAGSTVVDSKDPTQARFYYPRSLAFDHANRLMYFSDNKDVLLRSFDLTTRATTTVLRLGQPPAANSANTLGAVGGIAVAADGTVYFSDSVSHVVRRFNKDGTTSLLAGTGRPGADDGPGNTATFNAPAGLALGGDGSLYVADQLNNKIRRIDLNAAGNPVSTLAGTGAGGYQGDAGPARQATMQFPGALAISPSGTTLYVAEVGGARVRKIVLATGIIDTVAGTGEPGNRGEGGQALLAQLSIPQALAFDNIGNLYIADGWYSFVASSDGNPLTGPASRVLRVGLDGQLERVAGLLDSPLGFYGLSGDGGPATSAQVNNPAGLAFDDQGVMYIADTLDNRLRIVTQPSPSPSPTPAPTATPTATASDAATPTPTPLPSPTTVIPAATKR